jgi:hypothetical protein
VNANGFNHCSRSSIFEFYDQFNGGLEKDMLAAGSRIGGVMSAPADLTAKP